MWRAARHPRSRRTPGMLEPPETPQGISAGRIPCIAIVGTGVLGVLRLRCRRYARATPLRMIACANATSIRPAQQRGSDSESRAHRCQQHQITLLELAFLTRRIHCQWNGGGSSVSVAVDVD